MQTTLFATTPRSSQLLESAANGCTEATYFSSGCLRVIDIPSQARAAELLHLASQMSGDIANEIVVITLTTDHVSVIPRAIQLRHEVFIEEIGRDRTEEADQHDAEALHVVAFMGNELVGTLRCYYRYAPNRVISIGRVAIRNDMRRRGIGRQLMFATHRFLASLGNVSCILHAEETAVGFYEKLGYTQQGDGKRFMEAGKPHVCMSFDLQH